jgi:YggT family protein
MGGVYLREALAFLTGTLFGLYALIVALRFLLQQVRADFYNPVSRFIVNATQPPLRLLRRIIPGSGGIDWSSLVLLFFTVALEALLLAMIAGGGAPGAAPLAVLALARMLKLFIQVFIGAVLIQVILSWVAPGAWNPVTRIVQQLAEPLLKPARRLLPPLGGIDFSPVLVLIALQLLLILVVAPIADYGTRLGAVGY